jgi:hypothetical protein
MERLSGTSNRGRFTLQPVSLFTFEAVKSRHRYTIDEELKLVDNEVLGPQENFYVEAQQG